MSSPCSVEALERGEPLLGSASIARRHVLVSRPKGQWGPAPLKTPELAPLAALGRRLEATTLRLFCAEGPELEARVYPEGIRLLAPTLEALVHRLDGFFAGTEPGVPIGPTLGVCTHGKHDACCARFGQAVLKALRDGASDLDVVETSHLGGHRFAATLIHLIPGAPARMYGYLRPEDAPALVEHLSRGEVWLERYRGRCDLDASGQVAEGRALAAGATDPIEVQALDGRHLEARWEGGRVEIQVESQIFEGRTACGKSPSTWNRVLQSS